MRMGKGSEQAEETSSLTPRKAIFSVCFPGAVECAANGSELYLNLGR